MEDHQISHYFQLEQFSPFVPYGWNRNQVNMVLSVIAFYRHKLKRLLQPEVIYILYMFIKCSAVVGKCVYQILHIWSEIKSAI